MTDGRADPDPAVAVAAPSSGGSLAAATSGGFARGRYTIRFVAVAVCAVAVLLAVVLAKGLGPGRTVDSPLIGKPAPRFVLPLIDGDGTVDSSHFLSDVVVVNFWASWCVHCREEAPVLEAFARRWQGQGARVIGIVYNDSLDAARAFRDEFGLTYPQVDDPRGATSIAYGVTGVPETYVIDQRGIIVAKILGAVGPTTLDDVLAKVAAGQTVETRNGEQQQAPPPSAP